MSYRRYKDFDSVLQAVSGSTVLQKALRGLGLQPPKTPHTAAEGVPKAETR